MARTKTPKYTVQVKVVLVADVEVVDGSLDEAIALGRTWKLRDVVKLDASATECDSSVKVLGAYSSEDWGIDN